MQPILSNLLPAIVVALAIGVILQLRKKESSSFILSGLVITLAVWVITYLLSLIPAIQMSPDVFKAINYLCLASAGTFQLYFALDYANRSRWLTALTILIFLVGPVMVQAFFWSEYLREVFFYPEV
jgi:ABC-type amino acid transport system permease subunit